MNRSEYLNKPEVKAFVEWLRQLASADNGFSHSYYIEARGRGNNREF